MTRLPLHKFKEQHNKNIELLTKLNPEHKTIWYQNRIGFKKTGLDISPLLCPERISELKKCSKDIFYFIYNYLWIEAREKNKNGTRIWPFNLRSYQHEQVELYLKHREVALLYPRRAGKTSGTIAYFMWKMLFESNFKIMVYANKDRVAKAPIKEMKTMLKHLPLWMTEGIEKLNEHEIIFENGSSITAEATTADAGRASGANVILIDEAGVIENNKFSDFFEALLGVATDSTQIIMTSTPKGLNHWWKICRGASLVNEKGEIVRAGKNGFILKTVEWNKVPKGADPNILRDEAFKEEMIAKWGKEFFEQEYMCEFIGSAGTLLPSDVLKSLAPTDPIGSVKYLKNEFELKIYVKPKTGHRYCVCHDPAMGHGNDKDDNTGIHVLDVTDPFAIEQCAVMYRKDLDPLSAPYVLKKICQMYNNAFEISERNKCESIPQKLLIELDYDNLYIDLEKNIAGLYMTESVRNMAMTTMVKLFKNGRLIVHDYDFVHELSVFVKRGQKYQADEGEHDDLVTSFLLFCFLMSDAEKFENYFGVKLDYVNDLMDVGTQDQFVDIIFDDGSDVVVVSGEESWEEWGESGESWSDDDWF